MFEDPFVEEIRKTRQEILASYGGDFRRMCEDVMERQKHSGRKLVSINNKEWDHDDIKYTYPTPENI